MTTGQTEYPHHVLPNVHSLGAEAHEVAASIERAYDLQVSCNAVDRPQYLLDLEQISQTSIGGQEALQTKVSIERSLGRYSIGMLPILQSCPQSDAYLPQRM